MGSTSELLPPEQQPTITIPVDASDLRNIIKSHYHKTETEN